IIRGFISFPNSKMVNDTTIAILGALVLFFIPVNFQKGEFLLDWKTAVRIPWDVILLFGGGLALAGGFQQSGLAVWIAERLADLEGSSMVIFIGTVVFMTIFLTEVTSNTATATLLVPVMGSAAVALAINPIGPIVAACVAASYAFMLPVATPPNAVVFGSGCVTIPQMAKAGFWLNIIGTVLITVLIAYVLPILWGIDLTTLPAWAVKPA
ncbi:MAG: SLC13 family permease, partial [Desulfovibrionaceae bacterium]